MKTHKQLPKLKREKVNVSLLSFVAKEKRYDDDNTIPMLYKKDLYKDYNNTTH